VVLRPRQASGRGWDSQSRGPSKDETTMQRCSGVDGEMQSGRRREQSIPQLPAIGLVDAEALDSSCVRSRGSCWQRLIFCCLGISKRGKQRVVGVHIGNARLGNPSIRDEMSRLPQAPTYLEPRKHCVQHILAADGEGEGVGSCF
jgi:hypothetical protein